MSKRQWQLVLTEVVVETGGGAGSSRDNQSVRDAVIRDGDMGKDFANGADPLRRPPSVLFGRPGLRQASISLLARDDLFKGFRTGA
jgi:hypothetical protein